LRWQPPIPLRVDQRREGWGRAVLSGWGRRQRGRPLGEESGGLATDAVPLAPAGGDGRTYRFGDLADAFLAALFVAVFFAVFFAVLFADVFAVLFADVLAVLGVVFAVR
jgi:hypothetical protein